MSLAENVEPLSRSRVGNYEVTRFNALCHGVLSQHTVLPWEDARSIGRCSKRSWRSTSRADRGASRRGIGRHHLA